MQIRQAAREIADEVTRQVYVLHPSPLMICHTDSIAGK